MSEQQNQTATAVREVTTRACPHPEAVGSRWGDTISEERQAELQSHVDRWQSEPNHGERKGPFQGIHLSGAEVGWLADHIGRSSLPNGSIVYHLHLEGADLTGAHLERADLTGTHLEGADLSGAHLELAFLLYARLEKSLLIGTHLEGAFLMNARLEGTMIDGVHLEGAHLGGARLEGADGSDNMNGVVHLERADLGNARLDEANLVGAHLEQTDLRGAHLERAYLENAHLEGANLLGSYLDGAVLTGAQLAGADMRLAFLDRGTALFDTTLGNDEHGYASLADVHWGEANVAVVQWSRVRRTFLGRQLEAVPLGDEQEARRPKNKEGTKKDKGTRRADFEAAVRANRQVASLLRSQGLAADADRFEYKAQVLERQVMRRQGRIGAYLFSLLLAALSGYGYRIGRIFGAYVLIVLFFAAGYLVPGMLSSHGQLPTVQGALNALQISLNAIHGRVFFAQFGLDTLQSWLATVESIAGIIIEGVFVAMLIQRFFGR